MDRAQMVNNRNRLIASLSTAAVAVSLLLLFSGSDEGEELLALCKTPEATPKAVETLLEAGADVNARYEDGKTIFIRFAFLGTYVPNPQIESMRAAVCNAEPTLYFSFSTHRRLAKNNRVGFQLETGENL